MRLGLIARADNSGLGMQTWEFFKHMKPAKTMVVDISRLNGNKIYPERYPDCMLVFGIPTAQDVDYFLKDLDVVFVAEAPYNFYLYERAKQLGVKVAVQYNYEFLDWLAPEYSHLPTPDMLIAPSRWHYKDVDKFCIERGIKHIYLHCPANRQTLPFREIDQFKVFLHVAGRAAAHDRNGTKTVIEASKHFKSNAFIKIHFQGEQGLKHQATSTFEDYVDMIPPEAGNIMLQQNEYDNYEDVYKDGDVLLMPRRYGGNCLPLNEALSCGMPVIMTDIEPNNILLPPMWLVEADKIDEFTPRTTIDIYGSNPRALAKKIDELATLSAEDTKTHNQIANSIANQISWENMEPIYRDALERLCHTQS